MKSYIRHFMNWDDDFLFSYMQGITMIQYGSCAKYGVDVTFRNYMQGITMISFARGANYRTGNDFISTCRVSP